MAGLYIHIPFCTKKCTYCNFYSACAEKSVVEKYMQALFKEIKKWGGSLGRPIETLYIGGGTPSVLGSEIATLINWVKDNFSLSEDAEITVEMNPSQDSAEFLKAAKESGVNRLSIGVQSGNQSELSVLGRTHKNEDIKICVDTARKLGFKNISLDLMIGLPDSNTEKLEKSLDFITSLNPEHISAYILKIEEKTALYNIKNLSFCDDDQQGEQYIYTCKYLERKGYNHYEISNFAKDGFSSRHNNKYWQCEEYLGIGVSAHSFLDRKRFYYEADIKKFIKNPQIIEDGTGGEFEEKFMLALRLKDGINKTDLEKNFNIKLNKEVYSFIEILKRQELVFFDGENLSLTDKGMLLSNTVITELLERIV